MVDSKDRRVHTIEYTRTEEGIQLILVGRNSKGRRVRLDTLELVDDKDSGQTARQTAKQVVTAMKSKKGSAAQGTVS